MCRYCCALSVPSGAVDTRDCLSERFALTLRERDSRTRNTENKGTQRAGTRMMTFEHRVDGQLMMFESPGSVCVEVLHAGNK